MNGVDRLRVFLAQGLTADLQRFFEEWLGLRVQSETQINRPDHGHQAGLDEGLTGELLGDLVRALIQDLPGRDAVAPGFARVGDLEQPGQKIRNLA